MIDLVNEGLAEEGTQITYGFSDGASGSLGSAESGLLATAVETGRLSRLASMAAPQRSGSPSVTLIVGPGKIFSNTHDIIFGETLDGCPRLKRTQMAHCSHGQPQLHARVR
jgi:hypothetical protein